MVVALARRLLAYGDTDGSNQAGRYQDPTYAPVNAALPVAIPGTVMVDPNRWQPLALDVFFTQNGIPQPQSVQSFLGARWNGVTPFALVRQGAADRPYLDPGDPPFLGGVGDGELKSSALEVIRRSSQLDPTSGISVDISPGAIGNNPLGTNDGSGYDVNPVTGKPTRPIRPGSLACGAASTCTPTTSAAASPERRSAGTRSPRPQPTSTARPRPS